MNYRKVVTYVIFYITFVTILINVTFGVTHVTMNYTCNNECHFVSNMYYRAGCFENMSRTLSNILLSKVLLSKFKGYSKNYYEILRIFHM